MRRAEEARAEAVERFRSVFERAPVGMALVARDGRFTLANEAMGEFLGRPGGRAARAAPSATSPIPTTCAATARCCGGWWRGSCAEWNAEKRYVRPSGEVRWGALRALLLRDADGAAQHCLALVRDVTEQRLAQRRRSASHGVLRGSWPAARR